MAGGATADAARRPAISLANTHPVVVAGFGFGERERVTVRVWLNGRTAARVVAATSAGGFAARFPTLAYRNACVHTLTATAVGSTGRRAWLKLPLGQCPPPIGD